MFHLPRSLIPIFFFAILSLFSQAHSAGTISELRARHNEQAFDLRMEQQRFRYRLQSDKLPLIKQRKLNLRLQQQRARQGDLQRQQIREQNFLRQRQGHWIEQTNRGFQELRQRFRHEHQEQQFQFKREQEQSGLLLRIRK